MTFAVICGGGTGGHVQPAIALAEALVDHGHDRASVHFVGGRRGMEKTLVPAAGFSITTLPGRGIERRLTARNLRSAAEIASSVVRATVLFKQMKPSVAVSMGGYAGFPGAMAALISKVPLVVVTLDAVPGAANRLVAGRAAANAVAYPGTLLPRSSVTGPPVRSSVLAVDRGPQGRAEARRRLGLPESGPVLLATGGSLGARSVNAAAVGLAASWRDREGVTIYHVAGERNLESVKELARSVGAGYGALDYKLVGFEKDMPLLLAACDLALSRAGASMLAELTVVGVPSVLVPLPGAPSDHQSKNAAAMAAAGAAVVIADADCTASRLESVLDRLLGDDDRLESMSLAARSLGKRDAAADVAAIVERVAKPR